MLPALVDSVGHERRTTADYDFHGLKRGGRELALFQYTIRGAGRLRSGGREWTVRPGEALLLHWPHDHRYWLPAGGEWEFIHLCLRGPELLRLWREVEARHGLCAALEPDSPPVRIAAAAVRSGLAGEFTSAYAASARAYELVMALLAARPKAAGGATPHTAALARARAHAERDLSAPLGVTDLARAAGLSRFHFSRLFAAETGQAPAAWLATRRVQAAAQWLRGSELPLKEIAQRCGFRDVHAFGRVFRRHTGLPPARYRRSGP